MFHTFTRCCQMHIYALLIRHKAETAVSANAVVMAGLIKSWCSEVWNIVLVLAAMSGFVIYFNYLLHQCSVERETVLCRHAIMADVCYPLLTRCSTFFRPYLGFLYGNFRETPDICYHNCMPYKRRKLRRER